MQQKIHVYLAAGTALVWIVDTESFAVSVHRRGQEPIVLEGEAVLEDPVLPGFRLPLAELFAGLTSP